MNVIPLIYDDERHGDICIDLKNGKSVRCHKAVLIAASQFFAAELNDQTKCSLPFDDEIVTFCIQFIYGMNIPWDDIGLVTAIQIYRCVAYLRLAEQPLCTDIQAVKLCDNLAAHEIISECVKVDINRAPFFEIAAEMLIDPCRIDAEDYVVNQYIRIRNLPPDHFALFVKFLNDNNYNSTAAVLRYIQNGELEFGDSRYFAYLSEIHKRVVLAVANKSDTEFILAIVNRAAIAQAERTIDTL